jgi:hypothetical protein
MTMHEHLVFERPNAKYPRARRTEQVITYRREGGFDDEHDKYIDGLMPSRGPIKIVGSAITEADVAVGGILCNEEAVPYHTPEERQTLVEIRAAIAKLAG